LFFEKEITADNYREKRTIEVDAAMEFSDD
jgi:hypothetical protein